jgi:exosortase/archaeosortase family protein
LISAPVLRSLQTAFISAAFGPILYEWFGLTSKVSHFGYCLIVPILAVILARMATRDVVPLTAESSRWGFLALLGAGCLLTLGSLTSVFTISIVGFPLAMVGMVGITWGTVGLFRLRYALLLLFVMVPAPLPLLDWLTPFMVRASGATAVTLISPFDPGASWIGADLTYRGWTLTVADACSGSGTLLVLGTLTMFMAGLFRMSAISVLVTLLLLAPFTLLINGLRIATIAWMLDGFGPGIVTGVGHEIIGQIVVISGAASLVLVVDRFRIAVARWNQESGIRP